MRVSSSDIRFVCAAVVIALFLGALQAQAPPEPAADADAAYTHHDWRTAETLYEALTKQAPENARYWYRLGVAERGMQHYAPALEAFHKAGDLGAGKGLQQNLVDYELATTYSGMGDREQALKLLKTAADEGFLQESRLENDAEWNPLRSDQQFAAIRKDVQHNGHPCDGPEFSQFDFWIGDWDVSSTGNGVPRGTSHIAKEMGGCVVWENWTSASSPYFGKSYNTYNVNLKRWEQYWVDNFAGVMFFHGNLKDAVMDYWTDDVPQPDGKSLRRHLQFFNLGPGKVRQFSQGSTDGGKTWTVEYDLTYTKHADATSSSAASPSAPSHP
jgi:tetratricopeptide (TPR) repeat protein